LKLKSIFSLKNSRKKTPILWLKKWPINIIWTCILRTNINSLLLNLINFWVKSYHRSRPCKTFTAGFSCLHIIIIFCLFYWVKHFNPWNTVYKFQEAIMYFCAGFCANLRKEWEKLNLIKLMKFFIWKNSKPFSHN